LIHSLLTFPTEADHFKIMIRGAANSINNVYEHELNLYVCSQRFKLYI
jgi:hypothetical protein